MKSFRNPKYLERYEDVVFDLEQALATPANNAHQTKTGHRFVADNTGEATPFDWFNARISADFKVQLLDGNNFNNNKAVYKSGTGTRGRGHRDACVGTWDVGTRDEGLEDINYGTRGRGDVKYRDAGEAGCE